MQESRYERLLREKLELTSDMIIQSMTVGGGYADFPEYKYNLGYLAGLRRAIDAIEEVRDDLEKE